MTRVWLGYGMFSNQKTNLGKFWRDLERKKIDIFGIYHDHLVYSMAIW
jgi:hypothetical protein